MTLLAYGEKWTEASGADADLILLRKLRRTTNEKRDRVCTRKQAFY